MRLFAALFLFLGISLAWSDEIQIPQGFKKGDLTITPYGYFNVALAFNTQRMIPGDYALWAVSPANGTGGECYIDVKSSRFGLKFAGTKVPCLQDAACGGAVEVDFQQPAYVHRNRPGVMLRQAYIELVGKENRILAGQTWDVVAPLAPASLVYVPGSTTNLGYRRAQIRFEKNRTNPNGSGWLFQTALADNAILDATLTGGPALDVLATPQIQARVAKKIAGVSKDLPIVIGLSGHFGEFQRKASREVIRTWSGVVDVDIPITTKWRVQSEIFTGECLSTMLGGALIGFDADNRPVLATGGWGCLAYQLSERNRFHVGYCFEDMGEAKIDRTRNQVGFANWLHNWTKSLMTGIEVSLYTTDWRNRPTGESVRIESTARYTF